MLITCIPTSAAASVPASGGLLNLLLMSMSLPGDAWPAALPCVLPILQSHCPCCLSRRVSKGYDFVGDKGTVGSDGTINFFPGPDPRDTCDGVQSPCTEDSPEPHAAALHNSQRCVLLKSGTIVFVARQGRLYQLHI